MEYPQKLYVSIQAEDWTEEGEDGKLFRATKSVESQAEMHSESEVAVYQYVGKVKLINKTVIAEPDTP
jgi:acetylglutamate kinase